MTYTIAIAGTSGSGKSSLARAVAERLGAALLHFDDYEYPDAASIYPDLEAWIASGLPLAMHGATTLAGEVTRLRAGESVQHPKTDAIIAPAPFLVIEEPLGRARPAITSLIDLAVVIDTPPHIALARRLGRDLARSAPDLNVNEVVAQARSYLGWYASVGHAFYERMVDLAKVNADLIVDGMRPIGDLADAVAERATARPQ